MQLRALIVEDSEDDALLLVRELKRAGFEPTWERVDRAHTMLDALNRTAWDVILCDYAMPGFSGLKALQLVREQGLDQPFIIVSGTIGEDVAVEAMKAGAHDYIMKQNLLKLGPAVQREIEEARRRKQHRLAEQQLRDTLTALEQSNRDLERFAFVAAHDLQEPLRVVASYIQLIKKRYRGKLDTQADEFIDYAVEGVFQMKALIAGLLEYSRVKSTVGPLELVDITAAAQQAIEVTSEAIAAARADVDLQPLPTLPVDHQQMVQLFTNLIGNAIKFRSEQPPQITIRAERAGSKWIIAVQDNGIGIDPEHHEKVFTMFQRLNPKETHDGTGIGLAIAQRIVERHGGRIWVESKPGKGSTFYVLMPSRSGQHPNHAADGPCPVH